MSDVEPSTSEEVGKGPTKTKGKENAEGCPLKCAVPCCTRKVDHQTTFFPCPLEPQLGRLWAKAMGVKVILRTMYICADHFQLEDDLENYLKFKYYPRGQQRFHRFKKGVVPWKFPKCRGSFPSIHHHRVPFSKTDFYKRQRARINKAREILASRENQVLPEEVPSSLNQPQKPLKNGKATAQHVPAGERNGKSGNDGNVKATQPRRSTNNRTSGGRKNSSSSEKDAYFKMLNGDLSTLIAHVQPAICSWDVSEVRAEPAEKGKQEGSENVEPNHDSQLGDLNASSGRMANRKTSSASSKTSVSNIPPSPSKPNRKSESASSMKSDEESEDEIYMTPSEDEDEPDYDTSDTDFTVSSEESWGDHEIRKPTRRSTRNRSQQKQRPDRYSPPTVLRSRAKKRPSREAPAREPKSTEESSPQKVPETRTSDSGLSSVSGDASCENDPPKAADSAQVNCHVANESPLKTPKKSGGENFLKNSRHVAETIRAVSGCPSDSESLGASLDDTQKTKADSKSSAEAVQGHDERPSKVSVTDSPNIDENPKWSMRAAKSNLKFGQLSLDDSEAVATVHIPESQTSYTYKRVIVEKKPGKSGGSSRRGAKQDTFLVARDGDQVLSSSQSLPLQISGLITNMRRTFDAFFDSLDELKVRAIRLQDHSSSTEASIDGILCDLKKYPDLLELEMAQFAVKCEKFYDDQMEKSLKASKKIRWCNTCQSAARFHCCFSAAYCSRMCQSKDWGRHNRHCGQSRMLLDDPDLKLSPFTANRLKALEYSKPTIGASMSNLEQVCRRPVNGKKIILGSTSQAKTVKRSSTSGVIDSPRPKVIRTSPVKTYLPPKVARVSTNNADLQDREPQSAEEGNAAVKNEPMDIDMEVERGSPPPRPKLVLGYSLSNGPAKSAGNQQVRITIPPNLLAGLPSNVRPVVNAVASRIGQSNTTTVNLAPRVAPIAVVPRSTGGSLILPKPSAGASAPVTLRCRTVVLPSGETQYIPVDGQAWSFKPNTQLVVKHVNQTGNPVAVVRQATTSGSSILITRPTKPAYTKFMPVAATATQTTSTVVSPDATPEPEAPPPMTPCLPKLTPVTPKPEPAVVRTLDSSELDKILSTDHLKEAFDMSYASNILRP